MDRDLIRRLFATPPPEFVAARNAAVKELKAAKDKEGAAAVGAFRRPGWTDWALNVTADREPEAVESFAAAARQMREAQAAAIEGRDGPDLRVALTELREQTGALTRLGGTALEEVERPPETPELTARLAEVAGSATAIDELVAGILGSGGAATIDLFAGLEPAAGPRPAPAGTAAKKKKAAPAKAEPSPKADAAARRERQRQLARAEKEHEASMRDLARADAALAEADAAVEKATAELARLAARRDEAAGRREEAAGRIDRTKAALDDAREAAEED